MMINPNEELHINLTNEVQLSMVWCSSGSFQMGVSNPDLFVEYSSFPSHTVELTTGFWIATTLITYQQYRLIDSIEFSACSKSPHCAVELTTWEQVINFCNLLNLKLKGKDIKLSGRQAVRIGSDCEFDLPTEAQWEYACRANTTTTWFFGDKPDDIQIYAWCEDMNGNSELKPQDCMPEVAQKRPNPWGIYDLYGLVSEWCKDDDIVIFPEKLKTPRIDPVMVQKPVYVNGEQLLPSKIARGGDRYVSPKFCHSSARESADPLNPFSDPIGIRLVLNLI